MAAGKPLVAHARVADSRTTCKRIEASTTKKHEEHATVIRGQNIVFLQYVFCWAVMGAEWSAPPGRADVPTGLLPFTVWTKHDLQMMRRRHAVSLGGILVQTFNSNERYPAWPIPLFTVPATTINYSSVPPDVFLSYCFTVVMNYGSKFLLFSKCGLQ